VTPVEHVSREESDDHKAGRPTETWPERVISRQVDKNGKPAHGGEYEHDQNAPNSPMPGEEQLDLELPPRAMSFMNVASPRGVGRDALASSHPEALAPGQALER